MCLISQPHLLTFTKLQSIYTYMYIYTAAAYTHPPPEKRKHGNFIQSCFTSRHGQLARTLPCIRSVLSSRWVLSVASFWMGSEMMGEVGRYWD